MRKSHIKIDFLCLLRRSDLLRVSFSEETCGTAHALNLTNTICCANFIKNNHSHLNPLLNFLHQQRNIFLGLWDLRIGGQKLFKDRAQPQSDFALIVGPKTPNPPLSLTTPPFSPSEPYMVTHSRQMGQNSTRAPFQTQRDRDTGSLGLRSWHPT